jgi:hypothetical protein
MPIAPFAFVRWQRKGPSMMLKHSLATFLRESPIHRLIDELLGIDDIEWSRGPIAIRNPQLS